MILLVTGNLVDAQPRQVIMLVDTAMHAHDPDEAKTQQAYKMAEELTRNSQSKFDYAHMQAELAEAVTQLAAIEHLRKHHR